ncbi:MAG: hypothetical protein ABJG68_09565 [Crocinitomicaceae bacterium]
MPKKIDGAEIKILDQSLIKTTYSDNSIINATHLESMRSEYTKISGGEDMSQVRLLVVFEGGIEVSRDVGERYLTERVRPKIGEALVAKNPITAEYLKGASAVMKTSHPVRFFSDEETAKDWLLSL